MTTPEVTTEQLREIVAFTEDSDRVDRELCDWTPEIAAALRELIVWRESYGRVPEHDKPSGEK